MKPMRTIVALAAALLLSACILVEDFGDAWNEAAPEPCLSKIAETLYATEYRRDPSDLTMSEIARGWMLDGNTYLLLKKAPEDAGGRLYRFRVTNGIFQRYRLDPAMRRVFERDYLNAPVSLKRDTVTLTTLNDSTEKLLTDIANKPEYWQIEEQTLYNIIANDACRFDDRDLTALER